MLDFLTIKHRTNTRGTIEIFPDFKVGHSKDLMVRGGMFYAIWDEEAGLWSTDEYSVQRLIDKELNAYAEELKEKQSGPFKVLYTSSFSTLSWSTYKNFISKLSDQSQQLDNSIVFSNTKVEKKHYVSKRLSYPLEAGPTPAFDRLFGTLYDEENLTKLMWAIGSIIEGGSKHIQKFFVLFGSPGTGKSTALNLIQSMFPDYYITFEAQALTSGTNGFSTEVFRDNPLIGVNHEGDLSRIKDNSLLTSLTSHDRIVMHVKYKHSYDIKLNTLLFIATNRPVNITDARSGIIRRLIDIRPSGLKLLPDEYDSVVSQLEFELGHIADKCLKLYQKLGKTYYSRYKPLDMMLRTNSFYNFVDYNYFEFSKASFVTLARAWELYKEFCTDSNLTVNIAKHVFRDEFKTYWKTFTAIKRIDGIQYRSVFEDFDNSSFISVEEVSQPIPVADWLDFKTQKSVLDEVLSEQPAQYPSKSDTPKFYWDQVTTTLRDIKTGSLHFVKPRPQDIIIDFDLKDDQGNKSLALNIEAVRKFPPTYAELSKSGSGIHLHYEYEGDVTRLSRIYEPGIEVLLPIGNFSIRRKLTKCNKEPIARINSGLPVKGAHMVNPGVIMTERSLRTMILRNLAKEIHPATKPSVDFINTILAEAFAAGVVYDVSDLRPRVVEFASNSTNNALYCMKVALNAKYMSELEVIQEQTNTNLDILPIVFFDIEVFKNLFMLCWKFEKPDSIVHGMINPKPEELEFLFNTRLIGFNNRHYDNHMLYARYLGMNTQEIYDLSRRIIKDKDSSAKFREAYNVSYTDVLDYSNDKQSLKQWQIDLGLRHKEFNAPWDEPLDESRWESLLDYCKNDVLSLEEVHEHLHKDFDARLILAAISGLTPNDTTASHTARIVFGTERNPQPYFIYPDLSKQFPGYTYDRGVSTYRGEVVGEGGYVYSEPGIYYNVLYSDVASMHPTSIKELNLFGKFTQRYVDLIDARIAVKHGDVELARTLMGGALKPYLNGDLASVKKLAYPLKFPLNIPYGLTAASFDNQFRDPRNKDNVVAKRGALFMVDLKHALMERGSLCVHIKTDSVKVANSIPEDVDFIKEFGLRYGYDFEVVCVYKKIAIINKAEVIAQKEDGTWEATGATFGRPYVFKTMFSKEPITLADLAETKAVSEAYMYIEDEVTGAMSFVGKVGRLCPVKPGRNGGTLWRVANESKHAVNGTKGWLWAPAESVNDIDDIDMSYFEMLVDNVYKQIDALGDAAQFLE